MQVTIGNLNLNPEDKLWIQFEVLDDTVAKLTSPSEVIEVSGRGGERRNNDTAAVSFNVTGEFLGRTEVCPSIVHFSAEKNENVTWSKRESCLDLRVIRKSRPIDKAFTYSVAALVAIIYVNMGAALDVNTIRNTLRRPVGPAIGFMSQFVIMPMVCILDDLLKGTNWSSEF